ncbi:tail fiber domain-containing protein, partial [uncultured Kiloniella sp.]|uniref:tail fiber domain-containing protein n=1 Tax=uncultured Kiloniella sp. TaxID=1133091 RepID=UPI0026175DF7
TNALAGKADIASTLAGYGITNAYTQTETNTQINSAISALNLGTAAQSDPGDFAAASHNHTLSDVLGFGAAGGYIRSNGSGWARVSGIAWGDLTSIPTTVQNIDTELANKANWDTAFGWGDHASGGYLAASSYTAADVLTKLLTVDGAGTGLHADLLDGYEGSYYLDYNNLINKPTGGGTGDAVLADDETITGDWVFSSSLKVADSNAAYYPSGTWKQIISQQQDSAGNHGLSVMTRWGGSDSIIFEAASGWTGGAAQYSRVFNIDGLGVARLFDKSTDIERIKLTPSGYNPGAGIAAIETSGSWGGGIRMVDGAGSWMTWMSASGTVLNIGLPQASGTNNFSTAMTINSVGQIFWGTGVGRMDTNGTIVAQDVYADRGDNTGVIYFGSDASKYLYYSGTDYMLNGANLSVNGTYALLQNGTQTFGPAGGGVKTFHTTDGETIIGGGSAISSLQVMQNTAGTDAAITFHVSGDYAAQFGLCGDINDFAVGGWSMGANRYRIWHEGNLPTDTAATANTVMLRDGNGDTTARYGFATYFNMTHSEAGRYSDTVFYSSYDNFVRKNDAAGMRSSLAVPGLAGDNTFTGNQVIKNTSPTLFFQDIDHDSAMIHVNSSVFYVLRGTGSTTGWTSHSNGRWPMQLGLSATNPYASFAGNIYTVGQYYGGTGTATAPAFSFLDDTNTGVYQNGADHLNFATGGTQRGYWNSTSLYVNDLRQMSDRRAKKKIKDSPYGLKELLQLRPRKYIVKANGTIEIGFIAQEVEEIMPEFVDDGKGSKSSKGMKSLKYAKMVAVMTKAIQELEARVRELEAA